MTRTEQTHRAYALECKGDIQVARLENEIEQLRARQRMWRELANAARAYQDWLADPECFDAGDVATDLNDACYDLGFFDDIGFATASESTVPPVGAA